MAQQAAIVIDGLDDLRARMARLPATAQREVDELLVDLAKDNAAKVRRDAPRAGRQAASASRSVHPEGAAIVGGGPFFLGSVFGGQGRPTTQQFRPYRPESWWFFQTLAASFEATMRRFESAVDAIEREWSA